MRARRSGHDPARADFAAAISERFRGRSHSPAKAADGDINLSSTRALQHAADPRRRLRHRGRGPATATHSTTLRQHPSGSASSSTTPAVSTTHRCTRSRAPDCNGEDPPKLRRQHDPRATTSQSPELSPAARYTLLHRGGDSGELERVGRVDRHSAPNLEADPKRSSQHDRGPQPSEQLHPSPRPVAPRRSSQHDSTPDRVSNSRTLRRFGSTRTLQQLARSGDSHPTRAPRVSRPRADQVTLEANRQHDPTSSGGGSAASCSPSLARITARH